METKKVMEVSPEEYQELQALRAERAKREAAERKAADLEAYREMTDVVVAEAVGWLVDTSKSMRDRKERVFGMFDQLIDMKRDVIGLKEGGQRSHTFTNTDSTMRVTLGYNVVDGYLDTVNEGIELVHQYLGSLASDEKSKTLVSMVLQLLSTDRQGNLKASRIVQLRRYAEDSGSDEFMEGVRIIENSYNPTMTKRFISCQVKDKNNAWRYIPLGMTEVDTLDEVLADLKSQESEVKSEEGGSDEE